MKAKITHDYCPDPRPVFIHEGVKFMILGTEKGENGYFHTIQNTVSGNKKTVPHSVMERIVEF
jgi:hypothetical protein